MLKFDADKPVTKKDEDHFQRYEFAKRIANSIKKYETPDCLVFGISGVWGEGKTSVLNFIEQELSSSHPQIVCLRFNPWRYNDEKTLLVALFNSLAIKLKESIPNKKEKKNFFSRKILLSDESDPLKREREIIGELLRDYGKIVSIFSIGKVAESVGSQLSSVEIEEKKERIENVLKNLKKRIVIFIDDIDRLDKDEIYRVLKTVKLTGDFKYMTYILSFDEEMVASAIGERFGKGDSNSGYNFLEKIIQIPLKIPKAPKASLREFSIMNITSALKSSEIDFSEEEERRFIEYFTIYLLQGIRTPRLAARYGNALQFSLPIMKGEVNVVDLMLIEGIKTLYPKVYDFIKKYPDYFLGTDKLMVRDERENLIKRINSEYSSLSQQYGEINRLIQNLFPQFDVNYNENDENKKKWYSEKRICSPDYFERYFTYSLQRNEISDSEFENITKDISGSSLDSLSDNFKSLIESTNAEEFLKKIENRSEKYSWIESKKLSRAIARLGELFPNNSSNPGFRYYTPLSRAALFIYNILKNNEDEKGKFELAKQLLKEANPFDFAYLINDWLRTGEKENLLFTLDQYGELADLIIQRAREESKDSSIFEKFPTSYLIYLFGVWSEINKEEFNAYIRQKIDNDISKVRTLLVALTPTVSSNLHYEPYKGDFPEGQYNWMKNVFEIDYLYDKIEQLNNGEIDISNIIYHNMNPTQTEENIVKQFVRWYLKDNEGKKIE